MYVKWNKARKCLYRYLALCLCACQVFFCMSVSAFAAESDYDWSDALPDDYVFGKDSPLMPTNRSISISGNGLSMFGMLRSTAGSNSQIVMGASHHYGAWSTHEYHISTDAGSFLGYCAEPRKSSPNGTYPISVLNNKMVKAALLISPGGAWSSVGDKTFPIITGGASSNYSCGHALVGYLYSGSKQGLDATYVNYLDAMVEVLNEMVNDPNNQFYASFNAMLNNYEVYLAVTGSSLQDIVWIEPKPTTPNPPETPDPPEPEEPPVGSVRVTKESADENATEGNSRYSLSGAKFNLSNAPGTDAYSVTKTTDASGVCSWSNVPEGSYILTEVTASKGYLKYSQTIRVMVQGDSTTYKTVPEPPQLGAIEVQKEPKNECMVYQNPNYSLAGAVYQMTLLNDAGNKTNKVYTLPATDAKGKTSLRNLPLGTYLLEEIVVPNGYLKAEDQRVTIN